MLIVQEPSSTVSSTSYSSGVPTTWFRTFVHASETASSIAPRQSSVTPNRVSVSRHTRRTTGTVWASRGNRSEKVTFTYKGFPGGQWANRNDQVGVASG